MTQASCHSHKKHYAKGLCCSCYGKKEYVENRDKFSVRNKKNYLLHSGRIKENARLRYAENKEKINGYAKDHQRRRRKSDVQFKLSCALRSRINQAIKSNQKAGSAVKDLGCSVSHFRLYIENQFQDGMSWDNYGEWHLDHVMPLSKYDLTDRSQFLEASNWLNYQPLWAIDNIRKGDTFS